MEISFKKALKELQSEININEFNIWLKDLSLKNFNNGRLVLTTNSQFKLNKIEKSYKSLLIEFFSLHYPTLSKLELCLSEGNTTEEDHIGQNTISVTNEIQNLSATAVDTNNFSSFTSLKENFTFDTYIKCKYNKTAFDISKKVIEKLGRISPVYFYGAVGTGKTHLLHAIGNHYQREFPDLKIKCINPNDFVGEYTKALAEKKDRQFRLKYRTLDILLIDDIQFFKGKEKSSVEIFHIFNEIFAPQKQMIFCSDRVPDELDDLDDRLKSRISSSAIVEIESPKTEDQIALFEYYLNFFGLFLEPEVISFLGNFLSQDIRKIVGIVKTLVTYKDIYEEQITIEFCKKHLKQINFGHKAGVEKSPENLLLALCDYSKISIKELTSSRRTQTLAFYRQLLMFILRKYTKMSLPEIGKFLGGKTNSTILYGINKINESSKEDHSILELVDKIRQLA